MAYRSYQQIMIYETEKIVWNEEIVVVKMYYSRILVFYLKKIYRQH